ncbi:hypothetical protein EN46_07130 [Citrobacter amalonaticus]
MGLKIPVSLVRFRVRAPLIQRTRPKGGFLLLANRTLHRTPFDYSPQAAHPFGASATSALFNACGVSPSPVTTILKNPPKRRVFAFRTTVDFWSVQHIIDVLDLSPFLQILALFKGIDAL